MKYEKTEDPNIIKQIETVESEIHLDKLEKQIADLENQIKNLPELVEIKDYPDDVKAAIEEHNRMIPDKTKLEAQLKEKQELLTLLTRL